MTEIKENLSRRQERALLALLENGGATLNLVAKKAKISESSLSRYLKDDLFLSKWRELRAQSVEQAVARMQSLTGAAVETLKQNLTSGNRPSEVRTAISIIRDSVAAIESFDLAQRIARIEKQMVSKP
jgi:AcrR family transcriptional regulator